MKDRARRDAERALLRAPILCYVQRHGVLTFERLIMPNQMAREVITTTITGPALLSVPETAKVLGVPRTTVGDLIRSGELRAVLIGRDKRIEAAEVARFLRHLEVEDHSVRGASKRVTTIEGDSRLATS
jgi:excisionase family DNA binding protein